MDKIIKQIKPKRESLGLSQKELSEKVKCSIVHLSGIENGRYFPSRKLLNRLCTVLEIDL